MDGGYPRRIFLKVGGVAAVGAARRLVETPAPLGFPWGTPLTRGSAVAALETVSPQELAAHAIDAAKQAGAIYADVRLTYTRWRDWMLTSGKPPVAEREELGVGVRALVNGYWGFASGPHWTPDAVAALGREAVHLAMINTHYKTRIVELASAPVVANGEWTTPVRIDPYEVAIEEIADWIDGVNGVLNQHVQRAQARNESARWSHAVSVSVMKRQEVFASTDGSRCMQTFYQCGGYVKVMADAWGLVRSPDFVRPMTKGWEGIYDVTSQLRAWIPQAIADIEARHTLPERPADIGRYRTMFDAHTVASLLEHTIGAATQIDRALGYEANAGGTSYLGPDPLKYLGTTVAAPAVTVLADRSAPGELATVRWDGEGVAPRDFPVIEDGLFMHYQTTREQVPWLASWYQTRGEPVRSFGCAGGASALLPPMQHTPNIRLVPARSALQGDDLLASLDDGVTIQWGDCMTDFQQLNGVVSGECYRIKHGRPVARMLGTGALIRAPEIWKNISALGGVESLRWRPAASVKGEPTQRTPHSVGAVPVIVNDVAIADLMKKG